VIGKPNNQPVFGSKRKQNEEKQNTTQITKN
jgi:hypothetical protein